MATDDEFDLADAYAVATPDDNRELYRKWADTYESDFMVSHGYVYHQSVSRVLLDAGAVGPVLDVGCGTGVVGDVLVAGGLGPIDGLDISPEMLAKAAEKRAAGQPVYRNLVEADLTQTIDVASDSYQSLISVGTFTFGHLPATSLAELFRVAAPGAILAIGIYGKFFAEAGFADWLSDQAAAGVINGYDLVKVDVYNTTPTDIDDDDDDHTALVLRLTMPI